MITKMIIETLEQIRQELEKNKDNEKKNVLLGKLLKASSPNNRKGVKYYVLDIVNNLKYIKVGLETPENIKIMASENGVMATRKEMYYCKEVMDLEDKEFIELVMCEIFNSMQQPRIRPTNSTLDIILSSTLLMLSSVDIIKEKITYGQKDRSMICKKFDYSHYNVHRTSKEILQYNYNNIEGVVKVHGKTQVPYYSITANGFAYNSYNINYGGV